MGEKANITWERDGWWWADGPMKIPRIWGENGQEKSKAFIIKQTQYLINQVLNNEAKKKKKEKTL